MSLDIRPDHLKIVEEILEKHLPDREVWAFGSRVNGTAKETSDLDLVVIGETPLDFQRLGSLRDDFSESNLPYKVDVVDWAKIGETFREIIRKDNVLIKKVNKKEWTEATFSELCDITRGASPRPINDWTSKNGVPWVKISDASASMSRFIEKTNEYIKKEAQSKSVTVFPGDLILSNSATPGIPKFMKIEACVHDGWLLLRNFRGISKVFAYYLLLHERSALIQQGNGSVFTNLKTEILKKHKILLPSLAEQRAIAHILGTLDDKIELNRRINETLEAMAQALFKSWFVDFDPVRAKMEGRPTGLPKEIEDLFPDSFEDSELGEIPRGWEVVPIEELATIVGGSTPSTKDPSYWNGVHNWATPKDLSTLTTTVLLETERKITDKGLSQIGSGQLPIGTLLLSSRAPIGYLAISEVPISINQGFIGMLPKNKFSNLFLLFWAKGAHEEIISRANGSTFLEISKSNFRSIPIVRPNNTIIEVFDSIIRPMYMRVVNNEKEVGLISKIRDSLLPNLLSGKIRLEEKKK